MFTIALDERGNFEKIYSKPSGYPIYIAGILFDDKDIFKELEREHERLERFFIKVCASVGRKYPEDLHGKVSHNKWGAAQLEKAVVEALGEFLTYGTFKGEALYSVPRKGSYQIFTILKSTNGKSELLNTDLSALVNDDYASNLYLHMAESLISRLIFHNPYKKNVTGVYLDLPIRTLELKEKENKKENKKIQEYRRLGYKDYISNNPRALKPNTVFLEVANEDVYRTALAREILHLDKKDLNIQSLKVRSIYYGKEDRSVTKSYAFLYLANAICSYFFLYVQPEDFLSNMRQIYRLVTALQPTEKPIFIAYHDLDTIVEKALEAFESRQYFKSLSYMYRLVETKGSFGKFYRTIWLPVLENKFKEESEKEALEDCLRQFQRYSYGNGNKQGQLRYIYGLLAEVIAKMEEDTTWNKEYSYIFYDTGFTTYNHLGDFNEALLCFKKCQELKDYVSVEAYNKTLTKSVVAYIDHHLYNTAKIQAERVLSYEKKLLEIKELMSDGDIVKSKSYGQALSQLGQVYAYLKDERAESYFLSALEQFVEGSQDYYITLSYLLHYYIMQKQEDKYETWAKKYFGGKGTIEEQITFLLNLSKEQEKRISFKYAFFVYIKALYTFYRERTGPAFIAKCLRINEILAHRHKSDAFHGHPWELIYKYLTLLSLSVAPNMTYNLWEKINQIVVNPGPAINHIIKGAQYTCAVIEGKEKKAEVYKEYLISALLEDSLDTMVLDVEEEDLDRIQSEDIDKIMTYMFV